MTNTVNERAPLSGEPVTLLPAQAAVTLKAVQVALDLTGFLVSLFCEDCEASDDGVCGTHADMLGLIAEYRDLWRGLTGEPAPVPVGGAR